MLPTKFGVNWLLGLGVEAKNRFSRWRPWWQSCISDWHDFIFDLQVTLMLPSKLGVNWPFGSGEEAKNRFSRWRTSWISNLKDFSYFWSTSHPDASYQVSSQLAQGHRRSRLLKQLLTPNEGQRMTHDRGRILVDHNSSPWAHPAQVSKVFKQIWLIGFRGEVLWNSQQFSYYKCIGKQTWPCRKKVKCQRTTILLATLADFSSPMICAKIQPQGILGSGEEDFKKIFTIYGHGGHLGQRTVIILAIFCFPTQRWLHMKFEQNWLRAFRGEVVWNSQQFSHSNVWGSYKCIGKRTWPCRKKVKRQCKTILLANLVDLPSPMIRAKI